MVFCFIRHCHEHMKRIHNAVITVHVKKVHPHFTPDRHQCLGCPSDYKPNTSTWRLPISVENPFAIPSNPSRQVMAKATSTPSELNALRFVLNEHEYKLLHTYLSTKAPQALQKRAYTPRDYSKACRRHDEYSAATTRTALRMFVSVSLGLKSWDVIKTKLSRGGAGTDQRAQRSFVHSPTFRLALSLSTIVYLHRLLYRYFIRLRLRLLTDKAEQLRKRYPYLGKALTSRYTPAVGASLAGLALGIYPKDQLRFSLTIYMGARALEFLHDALDAEGYLRNLPKWFGSWLLFPLAQGQLLHAFVFDRDCFPKV